MTSKYNRDPCKTFMTLLDYLRHHYSTKHDEDMKSTEPQAQESTTAESAVDRIVRLSPRWLDGLTSRRHQSQIFLAILRKMTAAPSDVVLVKLMSRMARAEATTESAHIFGAILRAVVERMEGQTCLDRKMLFHETDNQEHIQTLLFARTSPLLVLRALPVAAFHLHTSGTKDDPNCEDILAYRDVSDDSEESDESDDEVEIVEMKSISDETRGIEPDEKNASRLHQKSFC